jgi:ribosomal protein S18 acetylase RimI-like enzyme
MALRVRRACADDAAGIAEVHVRTWQAAYEHVFGAERLATRAPDLALWEGVLARRRSDVYIADEDGVVGFVATGEPRDDDAAAELHAIYVLPSVWGTGAGAALMRAGLDAMRTRFSGEAVLWVLEDNPRARRFYEREHWALDGARKEDTWLGVVVPEVRYRIKLG